jgi:large subunit ribosomal protein L23
MQVSLYRQKLKRRGQKVLETKQLKKFAPTDIILGLVNTEKAYKQQKVVSKIKVPVLDKNGNKVKEKYTVTFKSGRTVEKERVKTETKEREKIKLTFKVMNGANKNDVKEAVKTLYGVDVEKVNIIKVPYKNRARRGLVRRAYVKAIVTLKESQKMPELDKVK